MTELTRNPNLDLHPHPHAPQPGDALTGERPPSWWTGPVPAAGRPLHALRLPNLATCTRDEVVAYFDNDWALTEVLFSALQGPRAFVTPPYHRLRHPLIFYYCHPAVLYVNKLRLAGLCGPLDPAFESLFETGVDEMSWDDLSQSELDWPSVDDVTAYRRRVYRVVREVVDSHPGLAPAHAPITAADPLWALFLSFEHERIHLETSSVLVRELPVEWVRRPSQWPALHPSAATRQQAPANTFVHVPGGAVRIGKPRGCPSFGWDNEYGERTVDVAPFHVQKFLVSNAEYLEFVKAEAYLDPAFWTKDGWGWRQFRNAKWPAFWVSTGPAGLHEYRLRTLFEVVDMPWSWPVEVNCHEARAYCTWKQRRDGKRYRLISEAKHHCLRELPGAHCDGLPAEAGHNLGLRHGSAGPVDAFAQNEHGVHDVFGNVWQWTEDHFHPLPGFKVHPLYDDFSTPCFDGQHQMILGGSFASAGDEASAWARFHFRPHFFQHAGFRLVESTHGVTDVVRLDGGAGGNVYEQETALREYLLLHYGTRSQALPFEAGPLAALDFPRRCAEKVIELARALGIEGGRALDVGCAVGRTSFELSRHFGEVLGVDLSERFIGAAERLRTQGRLPYFLKEEGELGEEVEAVVPAGIELARVRFRRADACSLPAELLGFDAVVAANLVCRLPSPRALLERLGGPRGLVRPGGLLFVTTPGTWSEVFTPREAWLGGHSRDGMPLRTFDGLKAALQRDFELVAREDLPLLIREHRRKYQFIISDMTAWRRRA